LDYEISEAMDDLHFVICDALGKLLYSTNLSKQKDLILISLKDFAKGNYISAIFNNGKRIKSCKFVID